MTVRGHRTLARLAVIKIRGSDNAEGYPSASSGGDATVLQNIMVLSPNDNRVVCKAMITPLYQLMTSEGGGRVPLYPVAGIDRLTDGIRCVPGGQWRPPMMHRRSCRAREGSPSSLLKLGNGAVGFPDSCPMAIMNGALHCFLGAAR